jgi:hypothetical protein
MSDFWWESEPLELEHQGSSSSMEDSLFLRTCGSDKALQEVPIEQKEEEKMSVPILCALYFLGQGTPFHSCSSRSGIVEETVRSFFHEFTTWMVATIFLC